jgi:DNA polymerase III subunit gamma/tau
MDQFVVSARKYRPATFNTVVGQSSITSTLKNAIRSNHLAQAFLFCGPRGVGKTTCARILAKTINCTNITAETEGCNECESCVSFNSGQSLNIFELDAASNNSVDDIRNLVDQVRYPPQSGKYKIYIIDEVHMLSAQAFNAFLKTLEEPPPYAIFILATTEKHKIIPTILSRCQIFDFNRITIEDIASHLKWIAQSENVTAEPEALHLIAQKADGALRDALSIFDQIVSYAGNTVTYKHVLENLNILDYDYYFRITDQILDGDYPAALMTLDEIIREGFDLHRFITGLASHFRDLLMCKDAKTVQLLEVGAQTKERYLAQSGICSPGILFKFLSIANQSDLEFKSSQNQRLLTELSLLKMSSLKGVFSSGDEASPASKKKVAPEIPDRTEATPSGAANAQPTAKNAESENPAKDEKATVAEKPVAAEKSPEPETTPSAPVTPAKEPATAAAATPNSRRRSSATVSISSHLNPEKVNHGDETAANENSPSREPDQQFSEQAMLDCLKAFADKLQNEGRRQLAVALNKHKAVLNGDNVIEIPVDNNIQADDIQANKTEILFWLKSGLKNYSIEIRQRVVEDHELMSTAYTPAEKFSKMAEKNPELNTLRQQFDLELDF